MNRTTQDSEGMPIGLQVVGHSYEDEKVLAIMKIIETFSCYKSPLRDYDEENDIRQQEGQ